MEFEIISNRTIADIARELAEQSDALEVNMSGKENSCSAEFVADKRLLPITTQAHALTDTSARIYAHTIARKVREKTPKTSVTVRYNGETIYPNK